VTSCWPRNTGKADFTLEEIDWTLKRVEDVASDWTGLTSHYRKLWHAAGDANPDPPQAPRADRGARDPASDRR
jgi:hypothetical protein